MRTLLRVAVTAVAFCFPVAVAGALIYCAIYPPPMLGSPFPVPAPVVQRAAKSDMTPRLQAALPPFDSVVKVRTDTGHGSGVHIGDGKFLTANHVVEGAKEFHIRAMDDSERDAEVLWTSASYDVALLQIKDDRDKFQVTHISCRQPRIWEEIFALGNPRMIEFVHTRGVVIGMPRKQASWSSVMVVDIPMYPGMSGGPVLDGEGWLIGLTVGGYMSPPMNLAVPSAVVCNLLKVA